ncbi:MAG: CCA tRNA nucleotidyltransferase [Candidatus Anammoxibacter sp.]
MDKKSLLYKTAVEIVTHIRDSGYTAFFAGGCVRDMLMCTEPVDYDIATNATPDEIMKIFKRTIPVGINFGVVNIIVDNFQFEIATFRSDGSYSDGRRPDTISFCDAKDDVQRRDFTINGMLYDPVEDRVLDYVGGRTDIKARLIKTIGDPESRFNEDHLRLIRAARFASRFSYDIEDNTKAAIKKLAKKILNVSVERLRDELEKGLTSANPHTYIKILDELNIIKEIMPEIPVMKGVEQPENFHPEGDVFVHTLITLSKLVQPSWELAMATLLHDVAKPATFARDIESNGELGRIKFYQHDNLGAVMAGKICKRLKTSTFSRERIMWLIKKHLCIKDVQNMKKSTLKKLFANPGFPELLELFRIDTLSSTKDLTNYEYCKQQYSEMDKEVVKPKPLVNGHDLIDMGLKPGPLFSQILSKTMDEQLEEKISTRDEALDFVKNIVFVNKLNRR